MATGPTRPTVTPYFGGVTEVEKAAELPGSADDGETAIKKSGNSVDATFVYDGAKGDWVVDNTRGTFATIWNGEKGVFSSVHEANGGMSWGADGSKMVIDYPDVSNRNGDVEQQIRGDLPLIPITGVTRVRWWLSHQTDVSSESFGNLKLSGRTKAAANLTGVRARLENHNDYGVNAYAEHYDKTGVGTEGNLAAANAGATNRIEQWIRYMPFSEDYTFDWQTYYSGSVQGTDVGSFAEFSDYTKYVGWEIHAKTNMEIQATAHVSKIAVRI